MKSWLKWFLLTLTAIFLLSACSGNDGATKSNEQNNSEQKNNQDKLQVITSFTTIEDMVTQIGKELVEVYNLVPTGTDPHEYEPLPEDIKKATDADVLFYNGMNLEGGENGWFFKLVDSVSQDKDRVFELNEGVEPKYLVGDDGQEEEVNPHSFLDPNVGIMMAENIRDAFIKIDPSNKDIYDQNTNEYLEKLREMDEQYKEKIAEIPENNRILVTSERAFQYMNDRYGLEEAFIWQVDTEEIGTPEQIKSLVEFLKERKVPVLFVETNVDPRPMETVSHETGIPIYPESIYSDEIGDKGEKVDTYIKLLQHNIDIISKGLTENS